MVREIYSSVKQGKSVVKQMIMGAGKTTGMVKKKKKKKKKLPPFILTK
jgi:hypothetical protein